MLKLRAPQPPDKVVRELSPSAWFRADTGVTVTGSGASMVADQADSDNALVLPGVAGNYASTPDSSAFPTGDIDIRVRISADDWTPTVSGYILSKLITAGQYSVDLLLVTTGIFTARFSTDGTALKTANSSAANGFTNGTTNWVRLTRESASGDVKFYTAPDSGTEPASWTQLGTTQTTTAGGIANGTDALALGAQPNGNNPFLGKIYRAAIYSTIGGTTPVFDANFAAQTKGATSFSESSSNAATVTVNQSGALPAHIGSQKDLLQGTDASRPPYLSYSGTKYLYLPGVANNYASTPDSVPASVTGSIEIQFDGVADNWSLVAQQTLVSKLATAGQYGYQVYISSGLVVFRYSADGTALVSATSSATVGFANGSRGQIKVTRDSASGDVKFYTATDGSTFSQLGATQATAAGSMFNGSDIVRVGDQNGAGLLAGKCYRARIYSTIGGTTPVVDFNPDLDGSDQAATITSSATGEVWTINKSGGLPAQIVGRPSLLFDGSADYLKCNAFTLNQPETVYIAFKQVSWTLNDVVYDGNSSGAMYLYQSDTTPKVRVFAGSALAGNGALAVGAYGVHAAVYNGASSVSQINLGTPVTGNAGASNAGGFVLGVDAGLVAGWSNIQVLEVIIFSTAHDATQRARIIQYLVGRHGIAL